MFRNKYGQVRSGWKIAAMMGSSFFTILLIGMMLGLIAGIINTPQIIAGKQTDFANFKLSDQIQNMISLISMFMQEIVLIVTPIIAWRVIQKHSLKSMGLTPIKNNSKDFLTGLLFGIVSISIVFFLLILTGNAQVASWTPHFSIDQITYLILFLFVGFAEEIFTRGYILSTLRQTRNSTVAVLVSSIIFAVMHSFNPGIGILPYINLTLVGILFAYMYVKSGNLWMCIGYHTTWNYFQGYIYGFKVSGQDSNGLVSTSFKSGNIFNGNSFGPEGGLFVTLVALSGILFVRRYYKNSKYDFITAEDSETSVNSILNTDAKNKATNVL